MIAKVTEQGVLLPRELFPGVLEVEVEKIDGKVMVVPIPPGDALFELGTDPVEDEITDASTDHDRYLYGPGK